MSMIRADVFSFAAHMTIETVKDLLTKDEYQMAQSSILDSYYTSENLIDLMRDIAWGDLNAKTDKVAKIEAGTGNFIGLKVAKT